MPAVYRFELNGSAPAALWQHSSGLRALVLGWIAAQHPEIAVTLHEAGKPKPYSIGPLISEKNGTSYFEVAALTDWAGSLIVDGAANSTRICRLGQDSYEQVGEPSLVESASWHDLRENPLRAQWRFRVISPVAHHATGPARRAIVAPDPALYFGSWLGRWQACSPDPLPDEIGDRVRDSVIMTEFHGGTQRIRLDGNRIFVGFVGDVTFDVVSGMRSRGDVVAALGSLAGLARYSGTGVETMRGMGQVRSQGCGQCD